MALSNDLISQFVKGIKGDDKTVKEATVHGTTVDYNGKTYVKLDGSDLLTPISTTADTKPGERVTVMIKNHTATVTGNISSPAARTGDVKELGNQVSEFEIVMAYKVTTEDLQAVNATIENLIAKTAKFSEMEAVSAEIESLKAKFAELEYVNADEVNALNATIEHLEAEFGKFTDISTEDLTALYADITTLKGYTADFTYVSADVLKAIKASVKELTVENLDAKYANIDFSNIGRAAIEEFFTKSGMIENVIIGDSTITGSLVGVTIKGDLIEAGTLKVDRLVILGSDGNYYKLNTDFTAMPGVEPVEEEAIHGSTLLANSVTAEKINVKDLVAFDATIGGFIIGSDSIHTFAKDSVDNITQGLYFGSDGQIAIGDEHNYIKYYRDTDGTYKLTISSVDNLEIGARNLLVGSSTGTGWVYDEFNPNDNSFVIRNGAPSHKDSVLTVYAPINGTTLQISERSGEINGTTLVLSESADERSIHNRYSPITLHAHEEYTLSFYVMRDSDAQTVDVYVMDVDADSSEYIVLEKLDILSSVGMFERFKYTFTPTVEHSGTAMLRFDLNGGTSAVTTLTVKNMQLERGRMATDWTPALEDLTESMQDYVSEQSASLEVTTKGIVATALESYVERDEFDDTTATMRSEFAVRADNIDASFQETRKTIEEVDGRTKEKFEELEKHITFTIDGIKISAGNGDMTLRIDNDIIIFEKNGEPFGSWDGNNFKTGNIYVETDKRAQFGDFAFVPRSNGSLSFLKVQ